MNVNIIIQQFPVFLLLLCRLSAFFVAAPLFSMRNVPVQVKVGLALFLSILVLPTVDQGLSIPLDLNYILLVLKEVFIGIMLGFIAYLFITAVQVAGSFIDLQMGFGIANVIDPQTGAQSPLTGNFKYIVAMLLFLSLNAHHLLIDGIIRSYQWIPLNNHWPAMISNEKWVMFWVGSFSKMFSFAFQMAAPIVGALFLTDVAMGIVARAVPQINIFVVGMPVKIIVGFLIFIIIIPGYLLLFKTLFSDMTGAMRTLMQMLGG